MKKDDRKIKMIEVIPKRGMVTTRELIKIFGSDKFYRRINELYHAKVLFPVNNSPVNPYGNYHLHTKWTYVEKITEKLKKQINSFSVLNVSWYASPHENRKSKKATFYENNNYHRDFENDYLYLKKLDDFLLQNSLDNLTEVSENERSLQIFGREKVIEKTRERIFKRVGLKLSDLKVYSTYEFPVFIPFNKVNGSTTVFIENEDPVYDLSKKLVENGCTHFLDKDIRYIGYAGGQALNSSLKNPLTSQIYKDELMAECVYVGDIDEIGLEMLFSNQEALPKLRPWLVAYQKMLEKAFETNNFSTLKQPSKNHFQIETVERFKAYFSSKYQRMIDKLVAMENTYIAQEILTIDDFIKGGKNG